MRQGATEKLLSRPVMFNKNWKSGELFIKEIVLRTKLGPNVCSTLSMQRSE